MEAIFTTPHFDFEAVDRMKSLMRLLHCYDWALIGFICDDDWLASDNFAAYARLQPFKTA